MRWEDERYVRLYTRDTPEFLALSWHARGLFTLILRKVDRAGILVVGKLGLRGVAVAVGGPWAEVEGPLRELLEDGCVLFDPQGAAVMVPNFLAAQEAIQSDAARKRASRERARATFGEASPAAPAPPASSPPVTPRDEQESQNVTNGHALSRAVTRGHSDPIRADPIRAEPNQDPPFPPLGGLVTPGERSTTKTPKRQARARATGDATTIPAGWVPNSTAYTFAADRGLSREDVDQAATAFRDNALAHGKVFIDWQAAFRTWIGNEAKWRTERKGGPAPAPEKPVDLSEYDGKRRPKIIPRPPDAPPGEICPPKVRPADVAPGAAPVLRSAADAVAFITNLFPDEEGDSFAAPPVPPTGSGELFAAGRVA